jgi:hypothetical protein
VVKVCLSSISSVVGGSNGSDQSRFHLYFGDSCPYHADSCAHSSSKLRPLYLISNTCVERVDEIQVFLSNQPSRINKHIPAAQYASFTPSIRSKTCLCREALRRIQSRTCKLGSIYFSKQLLDRTPAFHSARSMCLFTLSLQDYIHRVGRTARAGRSGRAVSVVTQYDVELFQRIEQLIGQKMEQFPAEQEEVLLLVERVSEAQRIATMVSWFLGLCCFLLLTLRANNRPIPNQIARCVSGLFIFLESGSWSEEQIVSQPVG